MNSIVLPAIVVLACGTLLHAHDLSDDAHGHAHAEDKASANRSTKRANTSSTSATPSTAPPQSAPFDHFAPSVKTRWDDQYLYIESNGIPAHDMMIGITAWQQQVPLPQDYHAANAWRLPLKPVPAREPQTIRDRFLRGAIAIAANGIPIFNPQNNRGEISKDIGELDRWGGHCGRADDYHYHAAPLHLQTVLGKTHPIAFALDGYPIYGLTEPDGSPPQLLDSLNGHHDPQLGYHYHASNTYPFVNGGFHGEVTERDGQVDPQPRATPIREALAALRGAEITGFRKTDGNGFQLTYQLGTKTCTTTCTPLSNGAWQFEFDQGDGGKTTQVHSPRPQDGSRGEGQRGGQGGGQGRRDRNPERPGDSAAQHPRTTTQPDLPRSSDRVFLLTSPVVDDLRELPAEFTGDGTGISPPLAWKGAPKGTRSFALIMDHVDPEGEFKWYWTLHDIPANCSSLIKDSRDIGKTGTGFRGKAGYEPPMSQGPGPKTYTITLYALSAPAAIRTGQPVDRTTLLAAIQGRILASSSLRVIHTRHGGPEERAEPSWSTPRQRPVRDGGSIGPQDRGRAPAKDPARRSVPGTPAGVVKPTLSDTIKLNVYADNWFKLYVNNRLVAVDPIEFTPHNVVSVDFLPEYPMHIAVLVKDNADPRTGLEYGDRIGDGGFILKFGDGTVTHGGWKAKCFFQGPLNGNTSDPRIRTEPLPENWWATDFDDRTWKQAKECSVDQVDPKEPFFTHDFKNAKFIWTDDLALDNTVVFRTRIDKPGWSPRWTTKPDLDVKDKPVGPAAR